MGISGYYGWDRWHLGGESEPHSAPRLTGGATSKQTASADTLVTAPASTTALAVPPPTGFSAADFTAMQAIHARFATGDFVTAARLADAALTADGTGATFLAWLREQLPVLLTSAGWSRLKLGDCDEATTYLRRSEVLKHTVETAKGLAVCYYKQKNLAAARDQFAFYLERQPADAPMQMLYTDLLESDARYDDAVKILEALSAAPPLGLPADALKQRLDGMRGKAREGMLQQSEASTNFRLSFRAGDHEDLVSFVLQTLEDALDEYIENYGLRAPPAPLEVVLYPAGDFHSIMVGGPEWAEGLFDGRLRIPIYDRTFTASNYGNLAVVLRHELVHALFALMTDSRPLPPWFDEGMAQRLSCAHAECGKFTFEPTPGEFLATGAFQSPYISLSAISAGRAYRQSLFLIMAIESMRGDTSLRQMVSAITTASDLSGDGLLAPLGLKFAPLTSQAAKLWQARVVPSTGH